MNEYGVRNKFDRNRVSHDFSEGNQTKQAFKDECDINQIMARYQKTGAMDHFATHQATYGDIPAVDFQEAMNLVTSTNQMFNELPSSIRSAVNNDPAQFLAFVQDPENAETLREWGLHERGAHERAERSGRGDGRGQPPEHAGSPRKPEAGDSPSPPETPKPA